MLPLASRPPRRRRPGPAPTARGSTVACPFRLVLMHKRTVLGRRGIQHDRPVEPQVREPETSLLRGTGYARHRPVADLGRAGRIVVRRASLLASGPGSGSAPAAGSCPNQLVKLRSSSGRAVRRRARRVILCPARRPARAAVRSRTAAVADKAITLFSSARFGCRGLLQRWGRPVVLRRHRRLLSSGCSCYRTVDWTMGRRREVHLTAGAWTPSRDHTFGARGRAIVRRVEPQFARCSRVEEWGTFGPKRRSSPGRR